ncbi:MAG: hypothetical protein M3440_07365, partial [Chloroflexota bacterium]|nr:hypothetical protein [Chloroflexota bacterium]
QQLLSSGESFSGDTAAFTDPAAVQIARSVASEGAISGSAEQPAEAPVPAQDRPTRDQAARATGQGMSERNVWIAIAAASGLIAIRGGITYRDPGRRRTRVDMRATET